MTSNHWHGLMPYLHPYVPTVMASQCFHATLQNVMPSAMLYFQILGCGVGQTLQWKRAFEQFWRPLVNKWSNHVPQKWNFTHKIEQLVQFVLTVIKICHLPPPFMPNLECTNCIVLTAFCKNLSTPTTVLTIMVSKYPRLNTPRVALQLLQTGSLYS